MQTGNLRHNRNSETNINSVRRVQPAAHLTICPTRCLRCQMLSGLLVGSGVRAWKFHENISLKNLVEAVLLQGAVLF